MERLKLNIDFFFHFMEDSTKLKIPFVIKLPLKADEKKPLTEIHQIFAQKMGCNEVGTVDCLRGKSIKELMANMNMFDEYNSK